MDFWETFFFLDGIPRAVYLGYVLGGVVGLVHLDTVLDGKGNAGLSLAMYCTVLNLIRNLILLYISDVCGIHL